jgi:acetyl esterase/lipase
MRNTLLLLGVLLAFSINLTANTTPEVKPLCAEYMQKSSVQKSDETANNTTITDYTINMDFVINNIAAGPCFGAKDANNFFMWQINIETGRVRFRPHSWFNGGGVCHENKDITSLINIQKGVIYTLRIDIKGNKASTWINNILIDSARVNPRGGNYGYEKFGFRSAQAEASTTIESATFDNIKVTTVESGVEKTLFSEDFSNPADFAFTGGTVVDGRLLMNISLLSWQRIAGATPAKFSLETDMTIISKNAGILFAAKDINNMYMWSISATDKAYPFLRRHIFTANNVVSGDVSIAAYFSSTDLIGKEKHVKIEVDNDVIKTYIGGILVDTYKDTSGSLKSGYVGFRAFNDNNTDEVALYDNIVLTDYLPNKITGVVEPVITLNENFETGNNPFVGADTVKVAGNSKLKMFTKGSDLRVLQSLSDGKQIYLYPAATIPNSKTIPATYKESYLNGAYFMVTQPSITAYFPKSEKATNTAVLIIPGGGYEAVVSINEGYATAQKLSEIGITAFVLKYRLPDDRIMTNRSIGPLQDAQRAIQIIRQRAGEWNLDPNKIGVMGFSAGGHLASTLGTHFNTITIDNQDNISLRPDFMILMYPVITMGKYTHQGSKNALIGLNASTNQVDLFSNEKQVTFNTPPTYIAHAYTDDVVPIKNSIMFDSAMIKANVMCEKHFFSSGGHGFGLTSPNPNENMVELIQNWLSNHGWLQQITATTDLHVEKSFDLTAYPNPFVDHLSVSFKLPYSERDVVLEIYDSKGQLLKNIYQSNVDANVVYTHTFKANQFNEGIYIVKLKTSQKVNTIKLMKMNNI